MVDQGLNPTRYHIQLMVLVILFVLYWLVL